MSNNLNGIYAASYTATGGAWGVAASWGGAGIPGAADNATIPNGKTITITNTTASVNNLTIQSGGILSLVDNGSGATIIMNSTGSLTVAGSITKGGSTNTTNDITFTTASATYTFNNTGTVTVDNINFAGASSTVNFSGNGTFTISRLNNGAGNGVTANFNHTGTFNISNSTGWTINKRTTIGGTGTLNFSGAVNVDSVCSISCVFNTNTLLLAASNSSCTLLSGANVSVTGNISVGIIKITLGYTLNVNSGATLSTSGGFVFDTPARVNNVTFNNSGTISVAKSININSTTGSAINNSGTFTVGDSILNDPGTFTNNANATFNIGGNIDPAMTLTATANGNTVNYNGSRAQTVRNTTYYNLECSGSNTKTLSGNTTVSANLTVRAGVTLANGGFTLGSPTSTTLETVGGGTGSTISGTGVFTLGGNVTVNYTGSGSITTGATISCPVALTNATTRTFTVNDDGSTAADLIISNAISTSGNLTKAGAGTLTLSGTNTYSGGTALNAGTININSTTALGATAGTFVVASGTTIDNTSGGSITLANNNPQTWNGNYTFTGTQSLNMGTGAVNMASNTQITVSASTLTEGGVISGATLLTKAGAGALTLNGTNTFTGGVTLSVGTLNIGNAQALGTVAGTFTIAGGTINNTNGGSLTTLNYPQTWNGNYTFTGTNNLNLGTGTVTMNSDIQITTTANTLTIGGTNNNGTRSLTKAGAGSLVFGSNAVTLNSLTISAGTLTSTSGNLSMAGNYTNNGTYTHNSGTAIFNGTANQTISGSNSTTFYNLTLNNTGTSGSNNITLSKPTIVSSVLTLTNGILNTDATNILTMNAGSTATSGSASSFVDGPMNKIGTTAFVFPVGNVAKWARIAITAPATAGTTFQAQYFKTPYTNTTTMAAAPTPVLKRVSANEYWTLNRSVNPDNVKVTLYWESATFSGINNCGATTPLRIAHWNGSAWENNNNAVTTTGTCGTAGTLSTNLVVTSFSPFTFGSDTTTSSVDPLPIELLSFNATPNGKAVDLAWTTASEINNDFFTIERTTDGFNFEMIGTLKGAGNSTWVINYTLVDNHPSDGVSYYRLKQTDYDGHTSYSELKMVSFEKNTDFSFNIYPNPTDDGMFNVEINADKNAEVLVVVHDVLGKEMYSKVLITSENGSNVYAIDPSQKLPSGVYLIIATSNAKIYHKKLVVNE